MTARTRGIAVGVVLSLTAAFLVWNGMFGLHVSRGEKQYLLEEARYRLGESEAPSLSGIMADTVRDGARQATWWGGVVLGLGLAATYAASRQPR